MCYHISQTKKDRDEISELFDYREVHLDEIPTFYHLNGFERKNVLVITQQDDTEIMQAVWSVAPPPELIEIEAGKQNPKYSSVSEYWTSKNYYGKPLGGSVLNTVSENLFTEKVARWKSDAMIQQKCVVLATGFFEPHKHKGNSYPHFVKSTEHEMFGFCGYYTVQDDDILTCSILTIEANEQMKQIHNTPTKNGYRMPMTIPPEDIDYYFKLNTADALRAEFSEYRSLNYENYTVSQDINSSKVQSNRRDILDEVHYPGLI